MLYASAWLAALDFRLQGKVGGHKGQKHEKAEGGNFKSANMNERKQCLKPLVERV
jgi:hypothetical protein